MVEPLTTVTQVIERKFEIFTCLKPFPRKQIFAEAMKIANSYLKISIILTYIPCEQVISLDHNSNTDDTCFLEVIRISSTDNNSFKSLESFTPIRK